MKLRLLILTACIIAASPLTRAGEIESLYEKLLKDGQVHSSTQSSEFDDKLDNHGVSEIGLERTPCFGTCPVYTFIIKSDGTFRYHGERCVQRKGDYTGTINPWQFDQLAQFIRDSRYSDLDDSYSALVTDMPTVYTTAVIDGKRKVISDYAAAGPSKLWAIEQLIDKLLLDAQWDDQPQNHSPTTAPATVPPVKAP